MIGQAHGAVVTKLASHWTAFFLKLHCHSNDDIESQNSWVSSLFSSVIRLCAGKKIADLMPIPIPILPVRHVASTKGHPSYFWDLLKPGVHGEIGNFVHLTVDEEGLYLNVVGPLPTLPAFDRANYDELRGPLTLYPFVLDKHWYT